MSVWGGGSKSQDRELLPKGAEPCHICGEDAMVEIKLKPCGHEICLECCNAMRAQIVFKADAGLKCPFCREFVDGLTDMEGRVDTVPDLVEGNLAAHKSMLARRVGVEKTVSTSVPDRQRLVPPVVPRAPARPPPAAAPSWQCPECRHANPATREDCSRCRAANPAHARSAQAPDLLQCGVEEVVRAGVERLHPGLSKAFLEAGMPTINGALGGTSETVCRALRARAHERLMRVVHLLTSTGRLERLALDLCGNYAVQNLLEATHRLRVEAYALNKQKALPSETFASMPSNSPCTSLRAYSELLKALAPALHTLAISDKGAFVVVKLVRLGSPLEVVYVADQAAPNIVEWTLSKDGALVVTQLVERLVHVALDNSASASSTKAGEALARMGAQLLRDNRSLLQCARHKHLGPALAGLVRGGLPHPDAFKLGHQLAVNAAQVTMAPSGCRTLEQLVKIEAADPLCREMVRDLACYTAKAMQWHLGELACNGQGGAGLVAALARRLAAEREDCWVRQLTGELVAAGTALSGRSDALDALCQCLALPLWGGAEAAQHWAALAGTSLDVAALRVRVQAARGGQQAPPAPAHPAPCELQPGSQAAALDRLPRSVLVGGSQPARRPTPPQPQPAAFTSAAAAPVAPYRPPPPGFAGVARQPPAAASHQPASPAPTPAAASHQPATPAPTPAPAAANGVLFPDGTWLAMPQPYSSSAAPAKSKAPAAEGQPTAGSSAAAAPPFSQPLAASVPAAGAPPAAVAQRPAEPSAAVPPARPQPRALAGLSFLAPAFTQAPQPQAQPLLPPAPPQLQHLPPHPRQQPAQLPHTQGQLPPHLQASQPLPPGAMQPLPPLAQPAPSAAGSGVGPPGPGTPPPRPSPQPPSGALAPQPQPASQRLPPPRPDLLLPHMDGAPRPPAPQAPPPADAGLGGYSSITEMLCELGGLPAPPPPPPRPAAYRPALRPAYHPPGAAGPTPAAGTRAALAGPRAPSPTERFLMPAAPPPAAYAAAAAPAAAPAAGAAWVCGVCTYRHEGLEAHFLGCAMCGSPQG